MSDLSVQERLRDHAYRLMLARSLANGDPAMMARLQRLPLFDVAVDGHDAVRQAPPLRYRRA